MRFLIGSLLLAAAALAQPCYISPSAKTALAAQPAAKVRDQFPRDYFVHSAYQDATWTRGVSSPAVQAEYRALKDAHPGDPLYATLYARAMTGVKTPEAIAILDGVLEKQPAYAYAHRKLAEIYASAVFRNDAGFQAHIRAYREACPADIDGWSAIGHVDDAAFLKETAAGLRKAIDSSTDAAALLSYTTLWTIEFKAEPLSEPVRERVRQDVSRLRDSYPVGRPGLWAVLSEGYKLLADAEGAKWIEEHAPEGALPERHAAAQAIASWRAANHQKAGESYADFQARVSHQADAWIRQWPHDPAPLHEKFTAMRGMQNAPLEEIVPVAESWLSVYAAHPGGLSPYVPVAQFYALRRVRNDQIPGLLEAALKSVKAPAPPTLSDLTAPSNAPQISPYSSQWTTWATVADVYIQIKRYDRARELLSKLRQSLDEGGGDAADPLYKQIVYLYWTGMAKLARAEDRKADELVFQRNAATTNPATGTEASRQVSTRRLHDLWNDLRGSAEGFDAFMQPAGLSPAAVRPMTAGAVFPWSTLQKPLPDFHFVDVAGKIWTLADLKGKVTLIDLWATWCGPCLNELPYLQRLYEKLRDRLDLQVLTLNIDDNPGLIAPFLKGTNYTFPVAPALGYVNRLIPEVSIPRTWIVDADGVLRQERIGFGAGGDAWIDETIHAMEKARR